MPLNRKKKTYRLNKTYSMKAAHRKQRKTGKAQEHNGRVWVNGWVLGNGKEEEGESKAREWSEEAEKG